MAMGVSFCRRGQNVIQYLNALSMKYCINGTIVENKQLSPSYFLMILRAPEIAREALPGQFIMVSCGGDAFLKRPMGLSHVNARAGEIGFIYRAVGLGTNFLKEKQKGEEVEVIGPLGNHFEIKPQARSVALVGGGTGIGPLILYAKRLTETSKKIAVYTFIGARSAKLLCGEAELRQYSEELFVATDDGSKGQHGFVTEAFVSFLQEKTVEYIITCGPTAMMERVASLAAEHTIPAQASLEEYMACGFGVCLGCPCETQDGYKMVCVDGPVFDTQKLVWNTVKTTHYRLQPTH